MVKVNNEKCNNEPVTLHNCKDKKTAWSVLKKVNKSQFVLFFYLMGWCKCAVKAKQSWVTFDARLKLHRGPIYWQNVWLVREQGNTNTWMKWYHVLNCDNLYLLIHWGLEQTSKQGRFFVKLTVTDLSASTLRVAIVTNILKGVSPKPHPTGKGSSARQPINRSTFSISPSYSSLSSTWCFLFLVSFSNVSAGGRFISLLNSLYRGIPLSRSRNMSIVARSIVY